MSITKENSQYLIHGLNELIENLYQRADYIIKGLDGEDDAINSPIEQLFFIEWFLLFQDKYEDDELLRHNYQDESTGKYKIDFYIEPPLPDILEEYVPYILSYEKFEKIPPPKLGIELDGHDWHEKTKEQVRYDKERERFLISRGWVILRFSGSEIYNNPHQCVTEVIKKYDGMINDYYKRLNLEGAVNGKG